MGFAGFRVQRALLVVFRVIRKENQALLIMAKKCGTFRKTVVSLTTSLPAPIPIRLHQALQVSSPQLSGQCRVMFVLLPTHYLRHTPHEFYHA